MGRGRGLSFCLQFEFLFQWFRVREIVELLKMGFLVDTWAVDTQPHCRDS